MNATGEGELPQTKKKGKYVIRSALAMLMFEAFVVHIQEMGHMRQKQEGDEQVTWYIDVIRGFFL